jgi:hypothetical protein
MLYVSFSNESASNRVRAEICVIMGELWECTLSLSIPAWTLSKA